MLKMAGREEKEPGSPVAPWGGEWDTIGIFFRVHIVLLLYLFSRAVVTNYHTVSNLTQHKSVIVKFCRSPAQVLLD